MSWLFLLEKKKILEDGVGGSTVPIFADSLLRGNRDEKFPQFGVEYVPSRANVTIKGMGFVLNQYRHFSQSRVETITECDVDDSIFSTKRDGRFGKNILPSMIEGRRVFAYNFQDENKKEVKYWRDIGTLDAYYEANMDLVSVDPLFNFYDQAWPIRTYQGQFPPAKFVFAEETDNGRMGMALDSIVSGGCIISGSRVKNCVLSPDVRVESHAEVHESVIMENVEIGERARIRRAIIDKGVVIPPDTVIGYDAEQDRKRFTLTDEGVVVITQPKPASPKKKTLAISVVRTPQSVKGA